MSRVLLQLQVNCNTYICNQLCNEATKPSQLISHGKQAPCIERQAFGVFQKEICEQEEQKQLEMATTSSDLSALRVSFLVVNIIAKVKKCRGPAPADPGYSKERWHRRGSGNNCLITR